VTVGFVRRRLHGWPPLFHSWSSLLKIEPDSFYFRMDRRQIKEARIALKMSQSALAKTAGLTSSEISRIECGYRDIQPNEAAAIAAALGLVPTSPAAPVAAGAPVAVISSPVPSVVAAPTSPVGTNLDDPANFTELPNLLLLERGALSPDAHRDRLSQALARATRILHTSRVRATVWREWRQFERKIQEVLRPV